MTNQSNSTTTCLHQHHVLNGTSFSCNSPTNCSGSTVQTAHLLFGAKYVDSSLQDQNKGQVTRLTQLLLLVTHYNCKWVYKYQWVHALQVCLFWCHGEWTWMTDREAANHYTTVDASKNLQLSDEQLQGMTEMIRFTFWIHHCDLIHWRATQFLRHGWPLYQKSCTNHQEICAYTLLVFLFVINIWQPNSSVVFF